MPDPGKHDHLYLLPQKDPCVNHWVWTSYGLLSTAFCRPLTLARAVLMFSMFSMLLTQLFGTLLQASRI